MLGKGRAPEPAIDPEMTPIPRSDFYGARTPETAHLTSVPRLAQHLVDVLPEEFEGLRFSATVYRYQSASPWLLDLVVFGLSDTEIDDIEQAWSITDSIQETLDSYNWDHHRACRFAGPSVVLLHEDEQTRRRPGRVAVRRYYLTRHLRPLVRVGRRVLWGWAR